MCEDMASIPRDLASGLVVLGPIAVCLLALQFLIRTIAGFPAVAQIEPWFLRVPIAIGVFVILVMSTGYLMRTAVGRSIEELIDRAINRIPGLRIFYNAIRLGVETGLRRGGGNIEPIRVEAWHGLRVTAFASGHRTRDDRLICFLPTAPNISTGYVIEVEEDDVTYTGESTEYALTRIISAGFGERDDMGSEIGTAHGGRTIGRVRASFGEE